MEEASIGSQSSVHATDGAFDENQYLEPVFEAFVCPLTKQVMKDPVTLENGQTYEREAIEKWFKECEISRRKRVCPLTTMELQSADLNPNVALQKTIHEWNLRNEFARLKIARKSVSSASSASDIMRVLDYVENLQKEGQPYRNLIRKAQVTPMVTGLLRNGSRNVRCRALEVLCTLAEDDKNKEEVACGDNMRTIVKFLHHELPLEREQAARLLYELSKSEFLSQRIGEINGAILILIGIASSSTETALTVQNAEKILENLEKFESNVLQMAENGWLQPLLRLFLEGSPETQISVASFLGDLVLGDDTKVLVAQTAGKSLVSIMTSEDILAKEMALKALNAISSYKSSAKLLIEVGAIPPLVEDLFTTADKQLPTRLKAFSATILADLVASGAVFGSITLDKDSRTTLISEDVIHNLLHLTSNSNPAIACELLRVLVGLTESPETIGNVVDAIGKSGATTSLIQFLEAGKMEIRLEAIRILHNVTPFMSGEMTTALCGSRGLSVLIGIASKDCEISEEQAVATGLLADLPSGDPELAVKCFLQDAAFGVLVEKLLGIHRGRIPGGRLSTRYFEGLVRVASKLTSTLDYPPAVTFTIDNELAMVFADLLQTNGLDNVQVASAKALANLSKHTKHLSRVPKPPGRSFLGTLLQCCMNKQEMTGLCKVHDGICSLTGTFCLVDGEVVNKLVGCLDHDNEEVVEAAFAALCTLLEDGLNVKQGALVLAGARAVDPITQILVGKQSEPLHRQAIWAAERLLRTECIALQVFRNSNVRPVLIDAYNRGDAQTRKIAENALKWVEVFPDFSRIF